MIQYLEHFFGTLKYSTGMKECKSAISFTFSLDIILKVGLFKNVRAVIEYMVKIKAIYIRSYHALKFEERVIVYEAMKEKNRT